MGDIVSIIEACYRADEFDDARWLAGIADAAAPLLKVRGLVAYLYRTRNDRMELNEFLTRGYVGGADASTVRAILERVPTSIMKRFGGEPCQLGRDVPFMGSGFAWGLMERAGVHDTLLINGRDATGYGCSINAGLTARGALSDAERECWTRVGAHFAAGYRLRRRLRASQPEAVLDPDGTVLHAEPHASTPAALDALKRAAVLLDAARGPLRQRDPVRAVSEWRGLIAARWSLVEQFEADGKRYVVARRNDPPLAPLAPLSPREVQVLGYASLGHSNKLIAYELGISASTVGVLLMRARKRLGVDSREALIAAFAREQTRVAPGREGGPAGNPGRE